MRWRVVQGLMKEIINHSTDPYFNMAMEEYSIRQLPADDNYFMLWQNQPAVIIGRNQNTIEEINSSFVEEHGIKVVRRMSGGGAVYHDFGNLNFTFVVDENQDFANFDKFTRPVINALKRLGIEAENNGRNDLTIAGKKFSGNAQYKHRNRLLHHGTILFNSNIEMMVQALNPSPEKISSKGIKSVRSRVTNIYEHLPVPVTIEEFKQVLTEEVFRLELAPAVYQLNESDRQKITELRNNKYVSWDWIYGTSPAYNVRKTANFSWGRIDIRLDVKRGLISGCKIFGDFFSPRDMDELESSLIGTKYREEDLTKRLVEIDLRHFFPQSEGDELQALLCST